MKVIEDKKNATAFPLRWECAHCDSVLLAEGVKDFTVTETDITMICPLCRSAHSVPWLRLTKTDTKLLHAHRDFRRMEMALPYA